MEYSEVEENVSTFFENLKLKKLNRSSSFGFFLLNLKLIDLIIYYVTCL